MSRWTSSVFAISISFLSLPSAHADFLIGAPPIGYSARLVHNDGSNSVALTGSPPIHEGYDTFVLSGDGKHIFQFANDLGAITTESWSATTGTYEGAVGPPLHIFNYSPPWPNGIVPNWTIGEVHTRSNFPSLSGDLLYVSQTINSTSKPLINVINTSTHQYATQLVPSSAVTQIFDFALGPGLSGPKTRFYVSTNIGLRLYDELPLITGFDPDTGDPIYSWGFQSNGSLPIPLSAAASFDLGPDGYLYVLDGTDSTSSIKRYNTSTGTLIDTFLTFAEYNYGGIVGNNLKFGPDGGLYFSSVLPLAPNPHTDITRFDVGSRQRTDFDLGRNTAFEFYVMPIPEPSSIGLLLIGCMFSIKRTRIDTVPSFL